LLFCRFGLPPELLLSSSSPREEPVFCNFYHLEILMKCEQKQNSLQKRVGQSGKFPSPNLPVQTPAPRILAGKAHGTGKTPAHRLVRGGIYFGCFGSATVDYAL
jgi:hypothetical protein